MKDKIKCYMKCLTIEICIKNLVHIYLILPILKEMVIPCHTIYTRNNMGQKCEGNCGLWVLNKIIKESYPEILKKIVGAVWKLPAK